MMHRVFPQPLSQSIDAAGVPLMSLVKDGCALLVVALLVMVIGVVG